MIIKAIEELQKRLSDTRLCLRAEHEFGPSEAAEMVAEDVETAVGLLHQLAAKVERLERRDYARSARAVLWGPDGPPVGPVPPDSEEGGHG